MHVQRLVEVVPGPVLVERMRHYMEERIAKVLLHRERIATQIHVQWIVTLNGESFPSAASLVEEEQ